MNEAAAPLMAIQFYDVRVWQDRLELLGAGSVVSSVKRLEAQTLRVKYGWQSENQVVALLFGVAMLVVMAFPLQGIFQALAFGETIYVEWIVGLLIPGFLAGWVFYQSLRRGLYLEIELKRGRRKFPLSKRCSASELHAFLQKTSELGWSVDLGSLNDIQIPA